MRDIGWVSLGLALGLLGAHLGAVATGRPRPDPFEAMDVERADGVAPAPDLTFQTLDGREVRLHELRGKVVLLGFFTTA
jgi:cytochrome oxidase Cu insertion factor (SCO1/SenC/PrrC family)